MTVDASGKHIWVSSLTNFEYLVLETNVETSLSEEALILHFDKNFTRLDWPCGERSYGYGDGTKDFFCVGKGFVIAFVFLLDNKADRPVVASEFIGSVGSSMREKVSVLENEIKNIDKNSFLGAIRIAVQRASVAGY